MVLDRHVAEAARSGDVDFIETWLQNLDRPEDINEVDATEYVNVHLEVVYHAITAMPEYSGKSFEELRLEETYQEGRDWGNRLRRVCADCGRSLTRENYSNTQLKKRVGDSRCKDCVVRVWPT